MSTSAKKVAYTVTAILPDSATLAEYVEWLAEGHVAHVIAAGALSGQIIRLTDPAQPLSVEVRYLFPTQASLEAYLAQHAPRLRAEGLARFPLERGIRFSRAVGTVELVLGS